MKLITAALIVSLATLVPVWAAPIDTQESAAAPASDDTAESHAAEYATLSAASNHDDIVKNWWNAVHEQYLIQLAHSLA
jgi:hypothetical protein